MSEDALKMSRKTSIAVIALFFAGLAAWVYFGFFHAPAQEKKKEKPKYCDQMADTWRACFASRFAESQAENRFTWPEGKGSPLKLRLVFSISNRDNNPMPAFDFFCTLPPDTGAVDLESVTLNLPARMAPDSLGNRFVKITIPGLAPHETRMVRMITALRTDSQAPIAAPDPRYLNAEPYIESKSADMAGLAKRLGKNTPLATARAVFFHVGKKIRRLPYDPGLHGADWCLAHEAGDCTEMAILATALCRASGIPARTLTGFVVNGDSVVTQKGLHNWAEAFINGRWILLDPYYSVFDTTAYIYVPFQIFRGDGRTPLERYQLFRVSAAAGHRLSVMY